MASCLVGELGCLKSLFEGIEIEEMNTESLCSVGRVKRCVTVCVATYLGISSGSLGILLLRRILSSTSSTSSSVCRITVHPGGKAEWCISRLVDLKVKPPKTGVTESCWPLGRCTCCATMLR